MIKSAIIFYDFETTSINPETCQPIQLAAIKIDNRTLEIDQSSIFTSLIKPLNDKDAEKNGLDPLTDEILELTHKTKEELEKAPDLKIVWGSFLKYLEKYNPRGGMWNAPIRAGHNNTRYDDIIIDRLSMQFGNYDEKNRQTKIFHPLYNFDTMQMFRHWFHNLSLTPNDSVSMDNLRDLFGISKENAHDAKVDVLQGAHLLVSLLKMYRYFADRTKFEKVFDDGRLDFQL